MIYIKIKGGLGNQFFQYSLGVYLHKKMDVDICLDYSFESIERVLKKIGIKKKYGFRNSQLEYFKIDPHKIQMGVWNYVLDYLTQVITKNKGFSQNHIMQLLKENDYDCRSNNIDLLNNINKDADIIITGYWQNIHYIEPIKDELIRQFELAVSTGRQYQKMLLKICNCESVGVHVRRGDFVELGWDKGVDYYLKAMHEAYQKISNAVFFVFSDDRQWVIKNLSGKIPFIQVAIDEQHADIKEFDLLKHCKHQIISESTFGWWAAYLNDNDSKRVFVPFDCRGDIWLSEWERIEY